MNMIKRLTAGIIAAAMALSLLPAFTLTAGAAGTVTISTAAELKAFADRVNSGETSLNATLTADIDLGGESNPWTPIGNSSSRFTGTFDGNNHKITGIYINSSSKDQGLFGYAGGTIKNLGVDGTIISSGNEVGGIVGYNYGTVMNCYNTGTISGSSSVGGIVGANSKTVTNCYNTGNVSGSTTYSSAGGIAGISLGTVTNCYNTGTISGNQYIGGVLGQNSSGGTMSYCYNTGIISSSSNSSVGGVVGRAYNSKVTNCYFLKTDEINAKLDAVGENAGTGNSIVNAENKNADEFKTLASLLGSAWTDSNLLSRPVISSNPEGGAGTADYPYTIPNLSTLENVRDYINAGNGAGEYFKLTADIDMSNKYSSSTGTSWTPIGDNQNKFNGIFDGGNNMITGLYITSNYYQGLFGYVGENGTVKNVSMVDGTVSGSGTYTGGVVGMNWGTVTNCYNTGTISGSSGNAGGVVGYNYGSSNVTNCYNTGSVSSSSGNAGGVVGYNYSPSGGNSNITNCYNTGSVSGSSSYAGGVVGYNYGSNVTNCYNTGSVSGSSSYAGGIAGCNYGSNVTNCYNTGSVSGNQYIGGVAGYNYSSSNVTNCYNTGSVSGSSRYAGGVVGYNRNSVVTNCYYLDSCGADDTYGTSKTEAEFNSGSVAWLLQNGQDAQVWGQALTADKDKYPLLTSDSVKKVLKVTFNKADNTAEYRYTNPGGSVEVPAVQKGYVWAKDGSEFPADTAVTADITIDAVKKFEAVIDGDIITENGTGEYANETASGFAAQITSNLNRATISAISVIVGDVKYPAPAEMPELTIENGSGITIGIIINGVEITSEKEVTFDIE